MEDSELSVYENAAEGEVVHNGHSFDTESSQQEWQRAESGNKLGGNSGQ